MVIAVNVADVFEKLIGRDAPIEMIAYDGSRTGATGSGVRVHVKSPRALRYLAYNPGELGFARAYVSGDLEIEGDLYTALRVVESMDEIDIGWRDVVDMVKVLGPRVIGPAPIPLEEIRMKRRLGRRHSKVRDALAISHHYDVSNAFYEMVLGPTMAYTCAVFDADSTSLDDAQEEKFDLVCRKLALQPGMRLLDVGCGWGGLVMHAAEHYGVNALGATLSKNQAEWAAKQVAERGLNDLAEVRHRDYRDVPETGFDVVSSIGLMEHIGASNLGSYFSYLRRKLRPQGRLLNHAIMRPEAGEAPIDPGGFMSRYVFPDAELEEVGEVITVMAGVGFEVQHDENLRMHYAKTLHAWCANLDDNWVDAVEEVGVGRARVWALYMAASEVLFATNKMQLHQVLATKTEDGDSAMPLRPNFSA